SGERKTTGQQFVKRDAKRVKIAARIDRTIHSSGLLRGHVSERAGDEFGRLRPLTLARQSRGNTETHQPDLVQSGIREHLGRFDVFVDETSPVRLAERCGEGNPTAKELFHIHGLSYQSS